eukprot:13970846-Heterocapsa_arctica.AAC.1
MNNLLHENYLRLGIEFIGAIWMVTTLVTTLLRCCAWSYRRKSSGTTDTIYQERLCYVTTTGDKRLRINRDCVRVLHVTNGQLYWVGVCAICIRNEETNATNNNFCFSNLEINSFCHSHQEVA